MQWTECPLKCAFRNIWTRTFTVVGYQMGHSLVLILLYDMEQSLVFFFFNDAHMANDLVCTDGFTVIYPLFINTTTADSKQHTSCAVLEIFVPSLWVITICSAWSSLRSAKFPITHKSRDKVDSLPFPGVLKCYFYSISCPLRQSDEVI